MLKLLGRLFEPVFLCFGGQSSKCEAWAIPSPLIWTMLCCVLEIISGLIDDGHSLRSISLEGPMLGATRDLDSAINIYNSVLKWNLAFMEALTGKFFSDVNMNDSALKCATRGKWATRERVWCTWRCSPLLFEGFHSVVDRHAPLCCSLWCCAKSVLHRVVCRR